MIYLKDLINKLDDKNLSPSGSIHSDIQLVQSEIGLDFPKVYIEFLELFGSEAGDLFFGDVVESRFLFQIQIEGRESYKSATGLDCPQNLIFILEHHGYSYYYFLLDGSENPDLYLLIHGDEITNSRYGKLKDFVSKRIEQF